MARVAAAFAVLSLVSCDSNDGSAVLDFCSAGNFTVGTCYPKAESTPGPSIKTKSTADCCAYCARTMGCNAWTLNDGTCYLKTNPTETTQGDRCVSAKMPPMPPPPPYKPLYPTPKGAKNVLFLAVDDMRPSIGAYNFTLGGKSYTPNIDKLADGGLLFTRAYVQYAYCAPSRNSFMSGRRPDTTRVWEFVDHFRESGVGADWVSMPQYFKQFGYLTVGGGKLYHPGVPPNNDWPTSWSPEFEYFIPGGTGAYTCKAEAPCDAFGKSEWCAAEVDKDASILSDQKIRDNCLEHLRAAKNASQDRPFFVGCGFHKPHAPYHAPAEFFDDLPEWEDIPPPADPFAPIDMPDAAWHTPADSGSCLNENPTFNGTSNTTRLQTFRRSYYAAIRYQDYNLGRVLDELETLGLAKDTIVILFGDHGYQLGEHATWAKMTNFELGVHIPFIIRAPWKTATTGKQTKVLAEMVDVYPTLAALAGLPDPKTLKGSEGINGTNLAPVFDDPASAIKSAAFSQFAKPAAEDFPFNVGAHFTRNQTKMMGYSVRVDEWRYTCWFHFNNETLVPETGNIYGRELYDHRGDTGLWLDWPGENRNLVADSQYKDIVDQLHQQVLDYIQLRPIQN